MEALWRFFLLALALSTIQGSLPQSAVGSCKRVSEELNIDVFTEVLSNHSAAIPDTITIAPLVGDMDPNAPAFEFRGLGLHLSDNYLSDSIRAQSCSSNEITMFGSVLFKENDSEGPVVELSYADSFGPSLPVFSLRMDALADEIIVAYRHLGSLHTEVFDIRLSKGKWRRYGVTLTGNQALVYAECELIHQRVIPLPDYCVNDSSVVVSVAESTLQADELTDNRMYAFLQNVGVHFGSRGIQQICPDIPEPCPSCGQFLRLVKKVYMLNQEVEELRLRVAELEGREPVVDCPTSTADCTRNVNGQNVTFASGTFRSFSDQSVCYCLNGEPECTAASEMCLNGNVATTTPITTTDGGQGDPDRNDTVTTTAPPGCAANDPVPPLSENETFTGKQEDACVVTICERVRFGFILKEIARYDCSSNYTTCDATFSALQVNISKCCFICSDCDFGTCPADSKCVVNELNEATCVCRSGLRRDTRGGECVDINECEEESNACPMESVCRNTEGSFQCICNPGYVMELSSTQEMTCKDIDECADPTLNNCTGNSPCHNTPGGFVCSCPRGTVLTDEGNCEAFCESPCENGGRCIGDDTCECHRGYTGQHCETDVNECDQREKYNCNHPRSVCVNTRGSFFCRCEAGYVGDGQVCLDLDECALGLDSCLKESVCVNVPGSHRCLCPPSNRGPGPLEDCTGSCLYKNRRTKVILNNKESMVVPNCRNCTCVDGELTCFKIQCDCAVNPPRDCCHECYRRDCEIETAVEGKVRIRPGQTWINPQNRCERTFCAQRGSALVPETTDLSDNCPDLNCPANLTIQPMGKCCPVCLLPQCTEENNKQAMRLRNGCQTCVCDNSQWTCQQRKQCAAVECEPEHILFSEDGCCPVCASQALNLGLCET